jgi:hypothetical protein
MYEKVLGTFLLCLRCPERRRGIYANCGYRQLLVENYTALYPIDEEKKQMIAVTVRYFSNNHQTRFKKTNAPPKSSPPARSK